MRLLTIPHNYMDDFVGLRKRNVFDTQVVPFRMFENNVQNGSESRSVEKFVLLGYLMVDF